MQYNILPGMLSNLEIYMPIHINKLKILWVQKPRYEKQIKKEKILNSLSHIIVYLYYIQ